MWCCPNNIRPCFIANGPTKSLQKLPAKVQQRCPAHAGCTPVAMVRHGWAKGAARKEYSNMKGDWHSICNFFPTLVNIKSWDGSGRSLYKLLYIMGWHCPKSLSFIETECRFNTKDTWSEARWGPRLDLKLTCPQSNAKPLSTDVCMAIMPNQWHCSVDHRKSVNQLFLVQRTSTKNKLPFWSRLSLVFSRTTPQSLNLFEKHNVTTFPGGHHQTRQISEFPYVPHRLQTHRTLLQSRQVHHNTCDLRKGTSANRFSNSLRDDGGW